MSRHASVDETFQFLEGVRKRIRDFAEREAALQHRRESQRNALKQRLEQGKRLWSEQLARETAEEQARWTAARDHIQSRHQARVERIRRARRSSDRQAMDRIENREGSRKHKLQTETMRAQRAREQGLARTESEFEEFRRNLDAAGLEMEELEKKARSALKAYGRHLRTMEKSAAPSSDDAVQDERVLLQQKQKLIADTRANLRLFRRKPLPLFFRIFPLWLWVLLCAVPLAVFLPIGREIPLTRDQAIAASAGTAVVVAILYILARVSGRLLASQIAGAISRMRLIRDLAWEKSETRRASETARLESEFQSTSERVHSEWNAAVEQAAAERENFPETIEQKATRAMGTNDRLRDAWIQGIDEDHRDRIAGIEAEPSRKISELTAVVDTEEAESREQHEKAWSELAGEWSAFIREITDRAAEMHRSCAEEFKDWEALRQWSPPSSFCQAAVFGRIEAQLKALAEKAPQDPRLALPADKLEVPLLLRFPDQGSIYFETQQQGRAESIAALNNLILRLLSTAPPGRVAFTIIDPVGLGQSFSGIMHLADAAEHVIHNRIWTQTVQIEQRLSDLTEHMEKVIQMYLRNEYSTISEYNEQAGNIAEKYHFLVVADFPNQFSDAAARRLMSIATTGARCGVYTLLHWDKRLPLPQDFVLEEFRKTSVGVSWKGAEPILSSRWLPGTRVALDSSPPPELAIDFIQKVGKASRDSNRVEVPFAQVSPPAGQFWTEDTASEIRVPIGRTGATKLQELALGRGTCQHGLVAGKTGSGKSTLFHVIVTNLAQWCSPEQVEFYLIDFKKGVEFKCYATHKLPHARVIAIESDREFGLSVLQKLDDELRRRGDLFRNRGVQDLASYRKSSGEAMPRTLLLIDEFQEFFVEDDKVAQNASLLLDRIVRQGRAFGIHVILGSQTLGGAYTVARATLGQMVIRIALQCNEADAYLIMDDNNPAPRLLSRPGEGIYNDTAGTIEGNSPFQTVWLPDEERDACLAKIRSEAEARKVQAPAPIVFEGNIPADIRENHLLARLLASERPAGAAVPRIWLGEPNSIKGPTEVAFQPHGGNHLLLVGQREEAVLSIFTAGLVALMAQHTRENVRFLFFDASPAGTAAHDYLEKLRQALPYPIEVIRPGEMADPLASLAKRIGEGSTGAPRTFLFVQGLQRFTRLKHEEDFGFSGSGSEAPTPSALFNALIADGPQHGIHLLVSCDSYNNVQRFLSRKAIGEFELRVLFQMSANDSASLIDTPKASSLGMNRALFFNEQEGHLETFRPYALPPADWIESVAGARIFHEPK